MYQVQTFETQRRRSAGKGSLTYVARRSLEARVGQPLDVRVHEAGGVVSETVRTDLAGA